MQVRQIRGLTTETLHEVCAVAIKEGEVSWSTGAEATTILRWNKQALRKYLGHHEALKHTFDLILTADLIYKLRNMDRDEQEIVNSRI
ncbi:MAG: hypothetical protein QGG40_20245 [Myxococcota bacterium]|nr:hypothetical protein [Myxococcota bacterium]